MTAFQFSPEGEKRVSLNQIQSFIFLLGLDTQLEN